MASVIVTGSLVVTGSTFVGAGIVTDGLDFYFDVGNINSFDYINNNKQTLNNIAKGGGNPYVSASFNIKTGSVSETLSPTSSYTPEFGGCLFVSRSAGAAQTNYPGISLEFNSALNPPITNTSIISRYFSGRSQLTYAFWYKHTGGNLGRGGNFFKIGSSTSANAPLISWFNASATSISIVYGFQNPTNTNYITLSSTSVSTNNWNYFCVTFNSGEAKAYINGELKGSSTPGYFASTIRSTGTYAFMGGSGGGPNVNSMVGYMGPAQIYGRALTQQEVLQNYHTMKGRFGIYN
jgi:hypothetical protein